LHTRDLFGLAGKTAVVTGGSIGLGAQMATGLAEAGANVVVAARKIDRCEELCAQLRTLGVKAVPVACDVSEANDCRNLVEQAVGEFGTIDILINNAGATWGADAMDYPMDKWHKVISVNLTGLYQLSALTARVMKEQGGGCMVNMVSVAGFLGTPPEAQNTVAYNASKGAVITLTKDLAVKWARFGIRVNAIAPGFFPTHMSRGILEKNQHLVLPRVPLNRLGGEDDLKGVVVFLASPASAYITGHCVAVEGGMMAQA
jgi:gluconate 5-dehydrogenase